jgi:serine/threonine-protein kinase
MAGNTRVLGLLEEMLDSGKTPEEACRDCPELLPEVRRRWQKFRLIDEQVVALVPGLRTTPKDGPVPPGPPTADLPRIPGYEVESVLGQGGMGVVYRARQRALDRPVAVKMLLAGPFAGPQELERFHRETAALACLRHPNVVQVHDAGDVDGRPYFSMELVEGGSLAQKLSGTPQPARHAAELLATLAGAMQVAHRAGIVHRDLKPANVLLTADGTPKVSDFGVARRAGDAGLTQTGVAIGTPAYMAPEQARGQANALGPAVDVYALGAILYECLTGRPPFRGETAAETVHMVMFDDPVPPSRLNPKVPRDLETICLTCLHKDAGRRYAGAADLAEDLNHYLNGEAIAARPEGRMARWVRRARRRPLLSAALAGVAILALALAGGALWFVSDRAAVERAADEDLREMVGWQQTSSWPEARAALGRAKARLGGGGSADVRRRLDRADEELALAARLEDIRIASSWTTNGNLALARADKEYEEAFRAAGFGQVHDDPEAVSARVAGSNVRPALVNALDDWATRTRDAGRRVWIMGVAQGADQDPTGWRHRARDPAVWANRAALTRVVADAPVDDPCVPLFLFLADRLGDFGIDVFDFLKRVRYAHPADFWLNIMLSHYSQDKSRVVDALQYSDAALVLRPDSGLAHNYFGLALTKANQHDDAIKHLREAVRLDPTNPQAHTNLAYAYSGAKRYDDAIRHVRVALTSEPEFGYLHAMLATNLEAKQEYDEALAEYRRAIDCDPTYLVAQQLLRQFLVRQGRLEEALESWTDSLARNPPEHDAWYGYAELCLFLGRADAYRRNRKILLDKFGATTDPKTAERVGRACLLLPVEGDELRQACALADRAATTELPEFGGFKPWFQFVQGLAEYRGGRFEQAIKVLQGEPSRMPGPSTWLVLAMAHHRSGRHAEARKSLEWAVEKFDWRSDQIHDQDGWIMHILRREAEGLILPASR